MADATPFSPVILKHIHEPGSHTIEHYQARGGYETARNLVGTAEPASLVKIVEDSGLRGRGGAGFPTGKKWSFLAKGTGKPAYLAVNGDESEPGTFKDRYILEKDPHQLLEGVILTCWAIQSNHAFIYLRGEFILGYERLEAAVREAKAKGFIGKNIFGKNFDLKVVVMRGAGAYICGEETGLIESLEGKRAYPRIKPPYFPAVLGLYMCPTIVNNVETLCHVKHIVNMGAAEYAKLGTPNNTGTRIVSLSGDVKRPGYFEIEVGKVTLGELINDPAFGGGLRDGRKLKAIIPGGSSAKVLRADERFKLKQPDGSIKEIGVEDMPFAAGHAIPEDSENLKEALRQYERQHIIYTLQRHKYDKAEAAKADAEVARAVQQGVSKDGNRLRPPMGYECYAKVNAQDMGAVVAYLRSLKPVPFAGQ